MAESGAERLGGNALERELKKRVATLVIDAQPFVKPGRWQVVDQRVARWIPSSSRVRMLLNAATEQPSTGGVKARVLQARRVFTAPRFVDLAGGTGDATSARVTKQGGLVLFEDSRHWVTHLRSTPLDADYARRRSVLTPWYANPEWSLDEDRRVLRERLAPGVPAERFTLDERSDVFEGLLRIAVSRAKTAEGASAPIGPAVDPAFLDALPSAEAVRWRDARAVDTVRLLGHGDTTPENVIGRNGEWQFIDFEDARDVPYLFDALSFVIRDAQLRGRFLDGFFDSTWSSALRAGGHDGAASKVTWLDVAALVAAEYHARVHGGDALFTLRRLTGGYR